MKKIALIGSTGSIGRQALDVVRCNPDKFQISALVCATNADQLSIQASQFSPRIAHCTGERYILPEEERRELFSDCDIAFIAAGGFAGLLYTLTAVRMGKTVALANKESLVAGGELVMAEAKRCGAEIVPVDSEHSAIYQALGCRLDTPFEKLILTASGGPFLHYPKEQLAHVTAAEALNHPTWRMGKKVTVDSATLLNKGYEIIEAHWLYGADYARIEAVVHPESIVHSLVCFRDGAALAQLGWPDMRVPIQLAMSLPDRLPCVPQLDLVQIGALHFERLPEERFPCFGLAVEAGKKGGSAPAVLNGAAEVAVAAFLGGSISFPRIAETIEDALAHVPMGGAESYEDIAAADRSGREAAKKFIYGK